MSLLSKTDARFLCLLVLFVIMAIAYSLTLPIMEGPDEPEHYGYIVSLRCAQSPMDLAGQERAQPPLYYLVAAAATSIRSAKAACWDGNLVSNSWWAFDAPPTVADNRNHYLHTTAEIDLRDDVRMARVASLVFGAMTVYGVWRAGLEILPKQGALLAATLAAFTPQFVQSSAQVSNDSAAAGLSAVALWLLLVVARRGLTRRSALWAGIALGFALLTKSSALALIPAALLAAWQGRRRDWSPWLILFGLTGVIGGWWYLRGWILFGDPLGFAPHRAMPWALAAPDSAGGILTRLPLTVASYWANFGWGDIQPEAWFYVGVLAAAALAAWGWTRVLRRRGVGALWLLPLVHVAFVSVALLNWMRNFNLTGGRLLFPAHAAVCLLLALGLHRALLVCAASAAFFGCSVLILGATTLYPAFHMTGFTRADRLPDLTGGPVLFGEVAGLLGYALTEDAIYPGVPLDATLCWETRAAPAVDYAFAFHIVSPEGGVIAARDSHYGMGRYPSSTWEPGRVFCDQFRVPVPVDVLPARIYHVEVAVYDPETGARVRTFSPDGTPRGDDFVGEVPAPAPSHPPPDLTLLSAPYRLGDLAEVAGYNVERVPGAEDTAVIRLVWHVLEPTAEDYTVFVHAIVGDAETPIAQGDRPPIYPTRFWQPGEWIDDTFTVAVPADVDALRILVGMYRPADGMRLPVTRQRQTMPGNAIQVYGD